MTVLSGLSDWRERSRSPVRDSVGAVNELGES